MVGMFPLGEGQPLYFGQLLLSSEVQSLCSVGPQSQISDFYFYFLRSQKSGVVC